jgi:hypothetical protein
MLYEGIQYSDSQNRKRSHIALRLRKRANCLYLIYIQSSLTIFSSEYIYDLRLYFLWLAFETVNY